MLTRTRTIAIALVAAVVFAGITYLTSTNEIISGLSLLMTAAALMISMTGLMHSIYLNKEEQIGKAASVNAQVSIPAKRLDSAFQKAA